MFPKGHIAHIVEVGNKTVALVHHFPVCLSPFGVHQSLFHSELPFGIQLINTRLEVTFHFNARDDDFQVRYLKLSLQTKHQTPKVLHQ